MQYTTLGKTDLKVSKICLGTMTYGEQNTEAEGHAQLDYALDRGVNFIDTAELYAIPRNPDTQGSTERIIGTWLKKSGKRDQVVVASKIAGPSQNLEHIRTDLGFGPKQLKEALHLSLERLQTDYLDLYQLHWPERNTNVFGKRGYVHDPDDEWEDNFLEVLETMQGFIREGKVRHLGLSNETPWGLMRFLHLAEQYDLPRAVSLQNPYSLLNRTLEVGLAEICLREQVSLLPYSPLAFGLLTDKYHNGSNLDRARLTLFPQMARYNGTNSQRAAESYYQIAQDHGLSLAQLALAFQLHQPFVDSIIIGATRLDQLQENIDSVEISLTEEVLEAIEEVQEGNPNPAP